MGRSSLVEPVRGASGTSGTAVSTAALSGNVDVLVMPAPWQPGVYRMRYVCAFDTRRVVDLSIALSGQAVPPAVVATPPAAVATPVFSKPRPPRNEWSLAEERAFIDRCQRDFV